MSFSVSCLFFQYPLYLFSFHSCPSIYVLSIDVPLCLLFFTKCPSLSFLLHPMSLSISFIPLSVPCHHVSFTPFSLLLRPSLSPFLPSINHFDVSLFFSLSVSLSLYLFCNFRVLFLCMSWFSPSFPLSILFVFFCPSLSHFFSSVSLYFYFFPVSLYFHFLSLSIISLSLSPSFSFLFFFSSSRLCSLVLYLSFLFFSVPFSLFFLSVSLFISGLLSLFVPCSFCPPPPSILSFIESLSIA